MPTTIEEQINYEDRKNIILSFLFVICLILFISCCGYCLMKKGEREEKEKNRYKTKIIQIESV